MKCGVLLLSYTITWYWFEQSLSGRRVRRRLQQGQRCRAHRSRRYRLRRMVRWLLSGRRRRHRHIGGRRCGHGRAASAAVQRWQAGRQRARELVLSRRRRRAKYHRAGVRTL